MVKRFPVRGDRTCGGRPDGSGPRSRPPRFAPSRKRRDWSCVPTRLPGKRRSESAGSRAWRIEARDGRAGDAGRPARVGAAPRCRSELCFRFDFETREASGPPTMSKAGQTLSWSDSFLTPAPMLFSPCWHSKRGRGECKNSALRSRVPACKICLRRQKLSELAALLVTGRPTCASPLDDKVRRPDGVK